jgi:hypothetical protein
MFDWNNIVWYFVIICDVQLALQIEMWSGLIRTRFLLLLDHMFQIS